MHNSVKRREQARAASTFGPQPTPMDDWLDIGPALLLRYVTRLSGRPLSGPVPRAGWNRRLDARLNTPDSGAVARSDGAKAGEDLHVLLSHMAIEVRCRQLGSYGEYVFTHQGRPVGQVNTRAWRAGVRRAGIQNFRWRDLRHT